MEVVMLTDGSLERAKTRSTDKRLPTEMRYGLLAALGVLSFAGEHTKQVLHTEGRFHLVGHVFAFAMIELLFVTGVRSLRSRLMWTGAFVLLGCVIEVGQHLVFQQPTEYIDIGADSLGVVFGLLISVTWSCLATRAVTAHEHT